MAQRRKKTETAIVERHPAFAKRLTPSLHKKIVSTHRKSRDFRNATAVACGIRPETIKHWIDRGLAGEERYFQFAIDFLKAERSVRQGLLDELVTTTSRARVQAITWLLEKRFRQYSRNHVFDDVNDDAFEELQGAGGGGPTPEQKQAVIFALLAAGNPKLDQMMLQAGVLPRLQRLQEGQHGNQEEDD